MSDNSDHFARGVFPVGVRTVDAFDAARSRLFPCEIWYPAGAQHSGQDLEPEKQDRFTVPPDGKQRSQMAVRDAAAERGTYPLIVFSHGSASERRRMSTFLCTHLASHGYVVAALDHSETIAPELARRDGETPEQKAARIDGWIANRVPDIRFLIDHLLEHGAGDPDIAIDSTRIGLVGYSFGGWAVLATTEADSRIRAVVALAPGGSADPKPGVIPAKLTFNWGRREVTTLYIVAENDVITPLPDMFELYKRTPGMKELVIMPRADHAHFLDAVEEQHEAARTMAWPGELSWIPKEMRPIAELCSGEDAHQFVRGLTVGHLDATLKA